MKSLIYHHHHHHHHHRHHRPHHHHRHHSHCLGTDGRTIPGIVAFPTLALNIHPVDSHLVYQCHDIDSVLYIFLMVAYFVI